MKKTRSTTLRPAWPSSDFSDRASDRMRSRSEKDYRLHKHFPPAIISQGSRGYMTSGRGRQSSSNRLSALLKRVESAEALVHDQEPVGENGTEVQSETVRAGNPCADPETL
ncbi:STOX2 protein, partial [Polyodon spathula]|nr:STOX2 protein [Polyodon spathula]